MHSPEVLKLLQQVLAPPAPAPSLAPEEERTPQNRATTLVLDPDDDMGLGGQQVELDEDLLKHLRFFFPDTLVLAAFDIVDRDGGGFCFSRGGGLRAVDRERDSRQVHLPARAGPTSSSRNQKKLLRIPAPSNPE